MQTIVLYGVGALVAGSAIGVGVALWAARRTAHKEPEVKFEPIEEHPVTFVPPPAPKKVPIQTQPAPPPLPLPRGRPERAPAMVLTQGVKMVDAGFERQGEHHPRAPILERGLPKDPPPPDPVLSEWARRQVGPVAPGRSKGVCSGCGTSISVSNARPLRIVCPVCGRTKLLA